MHPPAAVDAGGVDEADVAGDADAVGLGEPVDVAVPVGDGPGGVVDQLAVGGGAAVLWPGPQPAMTSPPANTAATMMTRFMGRVLLLTPSVNGNGMVTTSEIAPPTGGTKPTCRSW
jgi:hypothetical protein